MKSDNGTEIVELIPNNLVPKFDNNELKYDPHHIRHKLIMQNNGPFKKLNAQAKDVRSLCIF